MIKLSRETKDSEIFIENKNIVLDSTNYYYKIEDNFKGQLKINVKKENALIEFLYKQSDSELDIFDLDKLEFKLSKKYNIIKIPKDYSSKIIDFQLTAKKKDSKFSMYLAYSLPPYNYFSVGINENIFSFSEIYKFRIEEHYKGDIKLMEDEFYCIMIESFDEGVVVDFTIVDEKEKNKSKKLKGWEIALIVIACIVVILIILAIIHAVIKP